MKIEQALSILGAQPGLFCADDIVQSIRADERERLIAFQVERSFQLAQVHCDSIEDAIRADERERVAKAIEACPHGRYAAQRRYAALIRGLQ